MSTIKEVAPRDWDNDKFHGELLNKAKKMILVDHTWTI
jgi:hypothetical protein